MPSHGARRRCPQIEIERVFELGVVLAARKLWEDLGIGAAIRRCIAEGESDRAARGRAVRHGGEPA